VRAQSAAPVGRRVTGPPRLPPSGGEGGGAGRGLYRRDRLALRRARRRRGRLGPAYQDGAARPDAGTERDSRPLLTGYSDAKGW
jgi:hypothetical protein